MNGKTLTEKLIAYRLDLLPEEERQELAAAIENHPEIAAAHRAVLDGLAGGRIPIPAGLASRADAAWQQGMAAETVIPFPGKTRRPLRYSLAAAAALLLTAGALLLFSPGTANRQTLIASRQGDVSTTSGAIKPGFALTAGATGRARITLPHDGSIAFRGPGRLILAAADSTGKKPTQQWQLDSGSTRITLKPGTWERFALTTPHLNIQVTGTRFFVSVTDKKTTVEVKEGRVAVTEPGKPAKEINAGNRFESAPTTPAVKKTARPRQTTLSERIILNNGTVLTGRILSQTKDILTVRTSAGVLRIPRKDVRTIQVNKQ